MASELQGVNELIRQLRDLGRLEGGKPLIDAARAGIRPALKKARATAPVGSVPHKTHRGNRRFPGFLSRSVKTVVFGDSAGAAALLGVSREAFYGTQFVELGTSKMPKQPWLVPAFESTQSEQITAVVASLRRSIRRAIRANR